MSDTVIKVENISKKYELGVIGAGTLRETMGLYWDKLRGRNHLDSPSEKEFWALKDINFEVKRGEILGIIGKNGAGKSTLLKVLSRITEPTTGKITIDGRVASLLEVGTGFHPELTGRENVFLNGGILGMTRAEIKSKFDEIVDFSGVEKFIDTPVKRYSSGMYVRLAFAVAAHLEPEILVIDEVLSVGDAEFQKKCLGKMGEMSGGGRTVLFVSHNMAAVKELCSRALFLKGGKVHLKGKTGEVVEHYLSSNISRSNRNLEDVKRKGSGDVVITKISLLNRNGQEIEEAIGGEPLKIVVSYETKIPDLNIRELIVGVQIYDNSENFLVLLNSRMSTGKTQNFPNKGEARCNIAKLPLMSGTHLLTFSLRVNGILSDHLEFAQSIMVYEGDYYGYGYKHAFGRQGVFIDQKWTLPTFH